MAILSPRVTLTSFLGKTAEINDGLDTQISKAMTKKEFLEQYKFAVASSIKELKKINKEKIEQQKLILRKKSSSIMH